MILVKLALQEEMCFRRRKKSDQQNQEGRGGAESIRQGHEHCHQRRPGHRRAGGPSSATHHPGERQRHEVGGPAPPRQRRRRRLRDVSRIRQPGGSQTSIAVVETMTTTSGSRPRHRGRPGERDTDRRRARRANFADDVCDALEVGVDAAQLIESLALLGLKAHSVGEGRRTTNNIQPSTGAGNEGR